MSQTQRSASKQPRDGCLLCFLGSHPKPVLTQECLELVASDQSESASNCTAIEQGTLPNIEGSHDSEEGVSLSQVRPIPLEDFTDCDVEDHDSYLTVSGLGKQVVTSVEELDKEDLEKQNQDVRSLPVSDIPKKAESAEQSGIAQSLTTAIFIPEEAERGLNTYILFTDAAKSRNNQTAQSWMFRR